MKQSLYTQLLFGALAVAAPLSFAANSLLAPTAAFAAEELEGDPSKAVNKKVDEIRRIVKEEGPSISVSELDKKLTEVLVPLFDFEEMSKRCLAVSWAKATPAQQKEFVELFQNLLARNYLKRIKNDLGNSEIKVVSAKVEAGKAMVKTTVAADEDKVSIDYRLAKKDNVWKVYDVIIENVGLVSNYRSEFGETVRSRGFEALLANLRAKQ